MKKSVNGKYVDLSESEILQRHQEEKEWIADEENRNLKIKNLQIKNDIDMPSTDDKIDAIFNALDGDGTDLKVIRSKIEYVKSKYLS